MPPLLQDLYNQVQAIEARLPPPGSVPRTRLGWVGPGEHDVGWTADPDPQILQGHGDPNSVVIANRGVLYVDVDTPTLWQNSTGGDVWTAVGGSGSFTLGTYSDTLPADSSTTVNLDGSNHSVTMSVASPPAWFSAGSIITAGLYAIGATFQHATSATVPGQFFYVWGPGNGGALNTVDGLDAFPGTGISLIQETLPLTATDLPFSISFRVHGQSDVTAQVNVLPYVVPLLL